MLYIQLEDKKHSISHTYTGSVFKRRSGGKRAIERDDIERLSQISNRLWDLTLMSATKKQVTKCTLLPVLSEPEVILG